MERGGGARGGRAGGRVVLRFGLALVVRQLVELASKELRLPAEPGAGLEELRVQLPLRLGRIAL